VICLIYRLSSTRFLISLSPNKVPAERTILLRIGDDSRPLGSELHGNSAGRVDNSACKLNRKYMELSTCQVLRGAELAACLTFVVLYRGVGHRHLAYRAELAQPHLPQF